MVGYSIFLGGGRGGLLRCMVGLGVVPAFVRGFFGDLGSSFGGEALGARRSSLVAALLAKDGRRGLYLRFDDSVQIR